MRPGEVVDKLVLGDITTLWEAGRRTVGTREVVEAGVFVKNLLIIKEGRRVWRGELSHVMAQCRSELVGLGRTKNVRFRDLRVPGGLERVGIELRVDGIQVSRLQSVIELVPTEDIVIVTDLLVDTD